MNTSPDSTPLSSTPTACKIIYCILPDDGTDKRLLVELQKKQGIVRAGSKACRGIGALAEVKTKRTKLPESELVKKVFVICNEDQAQDIFDSIFWSAQLDKPDRGMMWLKSLKGCTPYELPSGIPEEKIDV
jgi:hypothetical protein